MKKDKSPTTTHSALAISIDEGVVVSGVGRTTLYKAIADGELPARKIGRRTVLLISELQEWLVSRPTRVASADITQNVGKFGPAGLHQEFDR